MSGPRLNRLAWSLPWVFLTAGLPASGQGTPLSPPNANQTAKAKTAPAKPSGVLDVATLKKLAEALSTDPITAPYTIRLTLRRGQVVMRGRVGTTAVHDEAIQTAIALNLPVVDELVTDTAEVNRPGASTPTNGPLFPNWWSPVTSNSTWIYPEPLFGRIDEPFAGMTPPDISYPPNWASINARRPLQAMQTIDRPPPLPPNTVEMTIDPRGVAVLRGNVPTLADRTRVGQELAGTEGVTEIVNLLETNAEPGAPRPRNLDDTPPPPPTPANASANRARPMEPSARPITPDARPVDGNIKVNPIEARATKALQRVPELRGVGLRLKSSDGGVVSLSGRVAGVKEAMLAFRAVQTTPGVSAVVDSLEFPSPDESHRNPLTHDVASEEVEPYLVAQLGRHLGELAHIDRLVASGDRLEIKATLDRDDDRARTEAILRSLPLLRGFKLETQLKARP